MRQLKGKVKENAKEKKERKKEFAENRDKAFSVGKTEVFQNISSGHIFHSSPPHPRWSVCPDSGDGLCCH